MIVIASSSAACRSRAGGKGHPEVGKLVGILAAAEPLDEATTTDVVEIGGQACQQHRVTIEDAVDMTAEADALRLDCERRQWQPTFQPPDRVISGEERIGSQGPGELTGGQQVPTRFGFSVNGEDLQCEAQEGTMLLDPAMRWPIPKQVSGFHPHYLLWSYGTG